MQLPSAERIVPSSPVHYASLLFIHRCRFSRCVPVASTCWLYPCHCQVLLGSLIPPPRDECWWHHPYSFHLTHPQAPTSGISELLRTKVLQPAYVERPGSCLHAVFKPHTPKNPSKKNMKESTNQFTARVDHAIYTLEQLTNHCWNVAFPALQSALGVVSSDNHTIWSIWA